MKVRFIFLVAAVLFLGARPSWAQSEPRVDTAALGRVLESLSAGKPGKSKVGILVRDVMSGQDIFAFNGSEPLNPASNTKIVTAACALKVLGPEFRFYTSIHGRVEDGVVRGPIVLKGGADPMLTTRELWDMARTIRAMGVRRVEGGVLVDDTYFDTENMPYAFDQQPSEVAAFRAPVGAASLNFNTLAVTIGSGPSPMSPAQVSIDPPGYADITNETVTMSNGANTPRVSLSGEESRAKMRVWGQVPAGSRAVTYTRRIDNPTFLSGHGLKAVLEAVGIDVSGGVQSGVLPSGLPLLAQNASVPLSEILWHAGKMSNNFVTETVFKTMGAETVKGPGSWSGAVAAASKILESWGIPPGAYTYRNGSGLFDANLFSAEQLVTVLVSAYLDATIRPEFVSQLATGGVDGTIRDRYAKPPTKRFVRAKTGTLNSVSSLAGYVFDAQGRRPIAFAILVTNADGYVSSARAYQEKIVIAIAEALHSEPRKRNP
jgi:D-alanyl-D-alanine carboxypeptidase/D-alanyl-D-alanine-endopeptidase (penicillin-binding protein 4)